MKPGLLKRNVSFSQIKSEVTGRNAQSHLRFFLPGYFLPLLFLSSMWVVMVIKARGGGQSIIEAVVGSGGGYSKNGAVHAHVNRERAEAEGRWKRPG